MGAAALFAIAPITLRNYAIFGELVPISTNGGLTLWQGVADAGGERFGARTTDRRVAREEAVRYGKPSYAAWWAEPDGIWRDRDRYRRSLEVIRRRPLWYLRAMLRRVWEMVSYHSTGAALVGAAAEAAEADAEDVRARIAWHRSGPSALRTTPRAARLDGRVVLTRMPSPSQGR
jgi:hypothetical protein